MATTQILTLGVTQWERGLFVQPLQIQHVNGHVPAGRGGRVVSRVGTLWVTDMGVAFHYGLRDQVVDVLARAIARVEIRRRLTGSWLVVSMVDGQRMRFRMRPALAEQARARLHGVVYGR